MEGLIYLYAGFFRMFKAYSAEFDQATGHLVLRRRTNDTEKLRFILANNFKVYAADSRNKLEFLITDETHKLVYRLKAVS